MPGASRTLAELTRSSRRPRLLLERALDDELAAGRVTRDAAGGYQLVPHAFDPDVLNALRAIDVDERQCREVPTA